MLSLRIIRNSITEAACRIEIHRSVGDSCSQIGSYLAEGGGLQVSTQFDKHRIILNDSLEREDVKLFGRYGIIELAGSADGAPRLYISGGKEAELRLAAPELIRLSREDHRHLLFLLANDEDLTAEFVCEESNGRPEAQSETAETSPILNRLWRIVTGGAVAGSPFVFTAVAAAQCKQPGDGGNYATGNGYNGINSQEIQNQEGNNLVGVVPSNNSGVTTSGFDWGWHTYSECINLGIDQATCDQFEPFMASGPGDPTLGQDARDAMADAQQSQYTLSTAQQQTIYNNVYPKYYSAAASSMNAKAASMGVNFQFSQLNVQWQTVMASMYFQAAGGNPSGSGGSRFMNTNLVSQVINGQLSAAMQNLSNYQSTTAENNRAKRNFDYLNNTNCDSFN